MTTFTLTITMGNEGMHSTAHVSAALLRASHKIAETGLTDGAIRDVNGNTVGGWTITEETPADGASPDCTVDCAEYGCAGEGGWTHATKEGE